MRVLFILKDRVYNNTHIKSYGLINSSLQVSNFLNSNGCESKVVTVIDGNGIDKEVYNYKPDVVVIEALWVMGDKLKELMEIKRYKNIRWVVRIHSDIGFLSSETYAIKYIKDYIEIDKPNLFIAPNNENFNKSLSEAVNYNFTWLPNIIDIKHHHKIVDSDTGVIKIGCFGSLRILKNQLFQAVCAMNAADALDKVLFFHINVDTGINNEGNPVLKNLEELFRDSKHTLIKHSWKENNEFQHLVRKMDLGLQLSYTESFNIIAADFINNDVPILVSDSISWMPDVLKTSTIDYDRVTRKIVYLYNNRGSSKLKKKLHKSLEIYNKKSENIWFNFIFENFS
jgi:hypothetical protein